MTKMSTMLGIIFFTSLFSSGNASAANCNQFSTADVQSSTAKVIFCVDNEGRESVIEVAKERKKILSIKGGDVYIVKTTPVDKLSKKQLREYGLVVSPTMTDSGGGNSGNNGGGNNSGVGNGSVIGGDNTGGNNNSGSGNNTGGNNNGNISDNSDGNYDSGRPSRRERRQDRRDRRRGGGGGGNVNVGGYGYDPSIQAQLDFDALDKFCRGLPDMVEDRANDYQDTKDQIEAIDIAGLQKAEADARKKMYLDCRNECIKLAITKDGPCSLTPDKLVELVSKDDLNHKLLGVDIYFGNQTRYVEYLNTVVSVDGSKVCAKVLAKDGCVQKDKNGNIIGGVGDCEAAADWIAAYNALQDGKRQLADLQARLSGFASNSKNCTIRSASDVRSPRWNSCSSDCLQRALDSCPQALADANAARQIANRGGYCPDCGVNSPGGSQQCILYGNCGVSKAAQIIGALGGIVTPIGLGLMNMSMNNRSLAACTAMYSMQVQQAQIVGLPPTSPMCGGMGGMGGGFMGGGAYNPMMGGMGGMGMGGMGMGGGMSPYAVLGMGMNPYGMGGMGMGGMGGMGMGGMGGMGMGGMGGMGMGGMPGMYNPYGMGGGMGINLGIGMNPYGMGGMGMGGMGMGGMGGMGGMPPMYNPYGGMGMGGMGGMYNPYGMGGMGGMGNMGYNPMMMQQQQIQSQMYNAQLQMSQNAAQQMAIQNSMMYGYNNAGSYYGMNNMYQSPYYSMGVNPSMYGYGQFGGGGYGGYGGYNPYGGGFGTGINFNAGLNFGVY